MGPGTDVWNALFQGSLLEQQVRLSFHDKPDCEVIAIVALDLRPAGWIVIGASSGSSTPIEYHLNRIREVEILGESAGDCEFEIAMPPMA